MFTGRATLLRLTIACQFWVASLSSYSAAATTSVLASNWCSRATANGSLSYNQLCDQWLIIEEVGGLRQILERQKVVIVQSVVQLLLRHLILAQKAVVVVTVLRWVDSDEVAAALVFEHRLDHDLFHPGGHLNEIFNVVLLVFIQQFIGHFVYLLWYQLLCELQSMIKFAPFDDFSSYFAFEKVVGPTDTWMVSIACVTRGWWLWRRIVDVLLWTLSERLLQPNKVQSVLN